MRARSTSFAEFSILLRQTDRLTNCELLAREALVRPEERLEAHVVALGNVPAGVPGLDFVWYIGFAAVGLERHERRLDEAPDEEEADNDDHEERE